MPPILSQVGGLAAGVTVKVSVASPNRHTWGAPPFNRK